MREAASRAFGRHDACSSNGAVLVPLVAGKAFPMDARSCVVLLLVSAIAACTTTDSSPPDPPDAAVLPPRDVRVDLTVQTCGDAARFLCFQQTPEGLCNDIVFVSAYCFSNQWVCPQSASAVRRPPPAVPTVARCRPQLSKNNSDGAHRKFGAVNSWASIKKSRP